jgi:hypothetical protein
VELPLPKRVPKRGYMKKSEEKGKGVITSMSCPLHNEAFLYTKGSSFFRVCSFQMKGTFHT